MEIKYQELTKILNKAIVADDIGNEIMFGLKKIILKGVDISLKDLNDLVFLFSSTIKGDYQPSITNFGLALGGIVYVCIPTDFLPDFLGPIGYIDDVAILKFVVNRIKLELETYRLTEAYHRNNERGLDLEYLLPLNIFTDFFKSDSFNEVKTKFSSFFPTEGSIPLDNMELVQYNSQKDYNEKGYQDDTIAFFPGNLDEVIHVFNNILYQANGKCTIREKEILDQIILPSDSTKDHIKEVLDNANYYYDTKLFSNLKKSVSSKLKSIEYSFSYDIISLKEEYFQMNAPKIDCYNNSDFNVFNVQYQATPDYINYKSIYEVVDIIKGAKNQNRFKVNYLIILSSNNITYTFNYNSCTKEVRVSILNSYDMFFENDLEKLIRNNLKQSELNILSKFK